MNKPEAREKLFWQAMKSLAIRRRYLRRDLAVGNYNGVAINAKFCAASDHLARVAARGTYE